MGTDKRRLWPANKCHVFHERNIRLYPVIKLNQINQKAMKTITNVLHAAVEKQLDIMYLGRTKINSEKHFPILLTFIFCISTQSRNGH
jgi:ribosomal protein S2